MVNLGSLAKGRVAVFIDAANILYSQQTLGWKIDYKRLKDFLHQNLKLAGLFFYTGKVGTLQKQMKFIKRLEKLDYRVTAKEVKFIKVGHHKSLPKGNLDVELALDAYQLKSKYDTLFLFSGDSDFAYLLDLLKKAKKRVIVFSTRGHVSKELLEKAKYIDLRKLKKQLEFKRKNQEPSEDAPEV